MQSVNNGERWFHLLSSQSTAFFPTVGNTTWNMLRHASIYRVTRSCKINQRNSVCQQKATTEKKHMSPFKRKICLFTATKDWKQILSSNVELCQIAGSQKKALAWKKLWWVLSSWETAETGGLLWCWREGKVTRGSERLSLLMKINQLSTNVPRSISQCTRSHTLLETAQAKDAALILSSYRKVKATCACPLKFFS